jgi:hypothetical protein
LSLVSNQKNFTEEIVTTDVMELKRSNLVLPTSGYELDREEMSYVEGGWLSAEDKAWIVAAVVVGAVAIGVAIWWGAWAVVAKIMGITFKVIVGKAGAAAVVSTLIAAIGISSSAAWNIVNFAIK